MLPPCDREALCTVLAAIAQDRQVSSAAPDPCEVCPMVSVAEAFAESVAAGDTAQAEFWAVLGLRGHS